MANFERLNQKHQFGVVLLRYNLAWMEPLLSWFHQNPDWHQVYVDDLSALFVHSERARSKAWPALDLDAAELFATLDEEKSSIDFARRESRVIFYSAVGRPKKALALWEETQFKYPERDGTQDRQAQLMFRSRRPADAAALLESWGQTDASPDTFARVAGIYLQYGRVGLARRAADRALEMNPEHAGALLQRGMVAQAQGAGGRARIFYTRAMRAAPAADPNHRIAKFRIMQLDSKRP